MIRYYCIDSDAYFSESDLMDIYNSFATESEKGEGFQYYLSCCQSENNGSLVLVGSDAYKRIKKADICNWIDNMTSGELSGTESSKLVNNVLSRIDNNSDNDSIYSECLEAVKAFRL